MTIISLLECASHEARGKEVRKVPIWMSFVFSDVCVCTCVRVCACIWKTFPVVNIKGMFC